MDEKQTEWWNNQGGFFGSGYLAGDDSVEGYLSDKKETLEERTKREVEGVIILLKLRKKDWILDVPCGYGRHSIELAKRGYQITGLDLNKAHLSKANQSKRLHQQKISENGGRCEFLQGDMRNLNSETWTERTNTIINMFYSFGFFESDEENLRVMNGFYNSLRNHGQLLLHTDVSPEMIRSGNYRLSEIRHLQSGGKLIITESYDEHTKRMNGVWRIKQDGKTRDLIPYSVRIYSSREFEDMARKVGFKDVEFHGSFKGEAFTPNSKEMIMVAKK